MTDRPATHGWVSTEQAVRGDVATCACGYRTPATQSVSKLQDDILKHVEGGNLIAHCVRAVDQSNTQRSLNLCEAVRIWYQGLGHMSGGCFHVVLDDGNLEANFIRGCLNGYLASGWSGDPSDDPGREVVLALGMALLAFPEDALDVLYLGRWWRFEQRPR